MKNIKRLIRKICSVESELVQNHENAKLQIFDLPFYNDITEARLKHLDTLNLNITGKSVIDMGCGIGRFSEFFAHKKCNVFCVDGREENIETMKNFYPNLKSAIVDLETDDISKYGPFDIVFCYGLLYHLADPFGFLKKASQICRELLIVETCITDALDPIVQLVVEDQNNPTQAFHAMGCRPSPSYVVNCLKLSGFDFIYQPRILPSHPQFDYKLENDYSYIKQGKLIRDIFIASRHEISNDSLSLR